MYAQLCAIVHVLHNVCLTMCKRNVQLCALYMINFVHNVCSTTYVHVLHNVCKRNVRSTLCTMYAQLCAQCMLNYVYNATYVQLCAQCMFNFVHNVCSTMCTMYVQLCALRMFNYVLISLTNMYIVTDISLNKCSTLCTYYTMYAQLYVRATQCAFNHVHKVHNQCSIAHVCMSVLMLELGRW